MRTTSELNPIINHLTNCTLKTRIQSCIQSATLSHSALLTFCWLPDCFAPLRPPFCSSPMASKSSFTIALDVLSIAAAANRGNTLDLNIWVYFFPAFCSTALMLLPENRRIGEWRECCHHVNAGRKPASAHVQYWLDSWGKQTYLMSWREEQSAYLQKQEFHTNIRGATPHKPQLGEEQLALYVKGTTECLAKIQSMLCCQRMKLIFNLITGLQVSTPRVIVFTAYLEHILNTVLSWVYMCVVA